MQPTDRQRDAFKASRDHRFTLYGGAAGGGKSYFLRWWCLRELLYLYAVTGIKGLRVGLFSMDYPTLTDRQISRINAEFPESLGKLAKTQADGYNFKLKDHLGGGTIALRNLDDPSKYRSAEFAGIAVEELTENQLQMFNDLRFRLRWPGVDRPNFVAATNPGGNGHGWVKALWIDQDFKDTPELLPLQKEFAYVPAKATDNHHLTGQYYQDLLTLPEQMRKALAEGDWNVFAGQFFREWTESVHVIDAFEIPWHWKIKRCGDWGYKDPSAFLWVACAPDGSLYVIGEWYGSGYSIKDQAAAIHEFERGKNVEKIGVIDDQAFQTTGIGTPIADQFREYGVYWSPCTKGPGSRVAGWNMIRKVLQYDRGEDGTITRQPILRVLRGAAPKLCQSIPVLVHDKNKVEDVSETTDFDHSPSALRYLLMEGIQPARTPDEAMSTEDAAMLAWARKQGKS
jgi:phage terminase large subunit